MIHQDINSNETKAPHRNKSKSTASIIQRTSEIHKKDGDLGIDFTLASSEEAQQAQKTSRKRKQIGSEANPRSTPAPRKKNRTAQSPSEEVRRVGEMEQIRSGGTERKPAVADPSSPHTTTEP